ncbi:hypothetical protein GCM10027072_49200 [Streptomyces bullii]
MMGTVHGHVKTRERLTFNELGAQLRRTDGGEALSPRTGIAVTISGKDHAHGRAAERV